MPRVKYITDFFTQLGNCAINDNTPLKPDLRKRVLEALINHIIIISSLYKFLLYEHNRVFSSMRKRSKWEETPRKSLSLFGLESLIVLDYSAPTFKSMGDFSSTSDEFQFWIEYFSSRLDLNFCQFPLPFFPPSVLQRKTLQGLHCRREHTCDNFFTVSKEFESVL